MQLFQIDTALFDASRPKDIEAAWADMVEMGLDKPPFPEFAVRIEMVSMRATEQGPIRLAWANLDYWWLQHEPDAPKVRGTATYMFKGREGFLREVSLNHRKLRGVVEPYTAGYTNPDARTVALDAGMLYRTFLVLLATRNVVREVKVNKLARLGIGKNKYTKTTTLCLGTVVSGTGEATPTGQSKRPHLRRGHIRVQKHGPRYQFSKKVWIEPMFVNKAEGDVAERAAYNVTGRRNFMASL